MIIKSLFLSLIKVGYIKKIESLDHLFFDVYTPLSYSITIKLQKEEEEKEIFVASGASFVSKEEAFTKALIEGVERIYFFNIHKQKVYKQIADAEKRFIPDGFTHDKIEYWIKSKNLLTQESIYLPAFFINKKYLPLKHINKTKKIVLPAYTTNGMSAEFNLTKATINALYEIVERDAVISTFLLQAPIKRINIRSLFSINPLIKKIYSKLRQYRLKWLLFDITTDLQIPVFLSLVYDKQLDFPLISPGAKANLSVSQAVIGSILESLMIYPQYRYNLYKEKIKKRINIEKLNTITDRGIFWTYSFNKYFLRNFLHTKQINLRKKLDRKIVSKNAELKIIINRFKKTGKRIFLYKFKNIFKEDILKKIFVVKTFSPDLQDIFFDEANKKCYINSNRLKFLSIYFNCKNYQITDIPHFFL